MTSYKRQPLGFKERLAERARRLLIERLGEAFKKSLTTSQCASIVATLESGGEQTATALVNYLKGEL